MHSGKVRGQIWTFLKLLVKDAKKRISAAEVIRHLWLETNNNNELETPARLKMFEARSVSMFAGPAFDAPTGSCHGGWRRASWRSWRWRRWWSGGQSESSMSVNLDAQKTSSLQQSTSCHAQNLCSAPLVEESMMNQTVESPC